MSIDRLVRVCGDLPNPVYAKAMTAYINAYAEHKALTFSFASLEGVAYQLAMKGRRGFQLRKAFEVTREYWEEQIKAVKYIQLRDEQ